MKRTDLFLNGASLCKAATNKTVTFVIIFCKCLIKVIQAPHVGDIQFCD